MKLYNPTPELIEAREQGVNFYVDPGHFIDVAKSTGDFLLSKFGFLGLVHIDIHPGDDKEDIQAVVVNKTVFGLQKYIEHLHFVIESYMHLDTELKTLNQYGTVFNRPGYKKANRYLELATRMLKDVEAKYGVAIASKELEEKTQALHSSIESLVAQFENDSEAKSKALEQEREANSLLKTIIPEDIFKRSATLA